MKTKVIAINIILFLGIYLMSDIFFSRFIFTQSVDHKCYEHTNEGRFYQMKKNCFANMRLISSINSFKVYTDIYGRRFSGEKKELGKKNIVFLGDSQTFGVGSDWNDTFVGMLEKKYKNFNFHNLAVPSYSPTVYNHVLKNFLEKNKTEIEKIFVLIDLTDVGDEANRWEIINNHPSLKNEKIFYKKKTGFSKFKKENFKGLYLMASSIRSFFREIDKNNDKIVGEYRPVDGNPTGGYIYTDHEILTGCNKEIQKTQWWSCGGVDYGLKKIQENIIELGSISSKINSELYIIIIPWPDTLNFGQKFFNWENYGNNLCTKSNCAKLINLFPKFNEIKRKHNDWLETLYLNNDIHLTNTGNRMIAEEIKLLAF